MKDTLLILMAFALLIASAGNIHAWDGGPPGKAPDTASNPAGDGKTPAAKSASSPFDETTTQYLKKFRAINSELVAAHRELYRYNNPDKTTKGINLEEIVNQQGAIKEAQRQEQVMQSKKASVEEKISSLKKDAGNLREDLVKYYQGNLPKNVSDAWQNEQNYTEFLISRIR